MGGRERRPTAVANANRPAGLVARLAVAAVLVMCAASCSGDSTARSETLGESGAQSPPSHLYSDGPLDASDSDYLEACVNDKQALEEAFAWSAEDMEQDARFKDPYGVLVRAKALLAARDRFVSACGEWWDEDSAWNDIGPLVDDLRDSLANSKP